MFRATRLWMAAGALAAVVAGCGGMDVSTDTGTPPTITTGPYQPMVIGATWTYHVDDQGEVYDKTSTVMASEDMGGAKAGMIGFKVQENVKDKIQLTWFEATDTYVRRHHDQFVSSLGGVTSDEWYEPYLLRVDESAEHLMPGATWNVVYTKTETVGIPKTGNHTETWSVDAVDEDVSVPAGNFKALKVTRTDTSDGSTKTQWFVRGVGKVREQTGAGHLEQLTTFTVP